MKRGWAAALLLVVGCGPTVNVLDGGAEGDDADSPDGTTGAFPGNESGVPPNMSTTGSPDTTTDGDDESTEADDGGVFLPFPDGCGAGLEPGYLAHCTPFECSQWDQDCPRGEKCMPWANDGGPQWNASRCAPVAEDPAAVGEPCFVEGSAVSGLDDCELGSMCFHVDPETLEGVCVAQCAGSPENPQCPGASQCTQDANGDLLVCLPSCNPLTPGECGSGVCLPTGSSFTCFPSSDDALGPGEVCESTNACIPGLACLPGNAVGCDATDCCTAFCDLTAGDPNPICAADQTCTPWYDGEAPRGLENVGVCVGVG